MPEEQREIYLDRNASGPVHPEVAAAVAPFLSGCFGNPSALYALGQQAHEAVAAARRQTAGLLRCAPSQVVFTSGGTEANNLAVKGAYFARRCDSKRHVILSAVEHPSVLETCRWLETQGAEVTVAPVDSAGRVEVEAVEAALKPETLLVAVMHANNETGSTQPVARIAQAARSRGALFHVDGVQAAGRLPIDVEAVGCDSYSISGHKFGGLKGAGALYVRDRSSIQWTQQGGHQEQGGRAGTENVPGIVALGKAAEVAVRDLEANTAASLGTRAVFDELAHRLPLTRLNGHRAERLPNTVNLCCLYADAMSVVLALSAMGIYVGTGSACASHTQEPSRVLRAMGLSDTAAFCSIRISTGPELTPEDARRAADAIAEVVERVRLVAAPEEIGACDEDCPCFTREE